MLVSTTITLGVIASYDLNDDKVKIGATNPVMGYTL